MTLLLLALARSTVPLLLAFAATLLHIPAVLRRKIVRTGLVLALVAAASACLSPAGPPVPKNLSLPTIPILQPVESGPMVISSQETPLSETASSVVPWTPGILYGAGILLGTIPLLLGALKLRRILRSARPATNAYVWSELDHAAHRAGIGRPELRISSMAASPFVAGLFRPKIVLPEDETTSQSVRAILSHEVAHIRSRDVAWRLFHRLLCLALWPQPLLWLLLRPARTIEEEACDQDALQGGIRASDYARTLLAVAEGPLPTSAVGMRTPGTSLTRRVAALLQPPTMTPRKRFLFMSFTMTAFVFAVGLAACLAASPQEPDDAAIPQGDLELSVVGAGGKPVTPTSAYLVAYGDAHDQPIVPLRVTQGRIHYRLDKANPKEAAVIVATAPGSAAGFRRVWPPAEGTQVLTLPSPAPKSLILKTPDGKPAAGIMVSPVLLVGKGPFEFLTIPPKLAATLAQKSDANGQVTFTNLPDAKRIAFDSDDARYAVLGADLETGEQKTEVRLIPAAEISGTVTRNGKPVAGVKVGAQDNHEQDRSGRMGVWAEAVTDAEGRYRLRRLPSSVVNVALFGDTVPGRNATAAAHEAVHVKEGGTIADLSFRLVSGAIITGTVYGLDGKPKAGAMVGVYGPAHPDSSAWVDGVTTGKDGRYTIHVPAGKQRVYPMDSRYEQDQKTFTLQDGETREQDFHLRTAGSILNALRRN